MHPAFFEIMLKDSRLLLYPQSSAALKLTVLLYSVLRENYKEREVVCLKELGI